MTIYASCGHVVEDMDDMYDVSVKGDTGCGAPCINYKSVCLSCYNLYKEQDMLLCNEEDEKAWMSSGEDCCGMC